LADRFSIALCTHNPSCAILARCLAAIGALLERHQHLAVVLVDNGSTPPLAAFHAVEGFLRRFPSSRLVIEPRTGLSWARRRAVLETTSDWLVFFDDDNEPHSDYLHVLEHFSRSHACVAVWGPGVVDVEFLDAVKPDVSARPDWFQQRCLPFGYASLPAVWVTSYPNGTGFAVRRVVLQAWVDAVERDELTASGRKGTSMASGEDIQIVWQAVRLGYAAGMLPGCRLRHLIPASRTSPAALARQAFGTASSYHPALVECFPEERARLPALMPTLAAARRCLRLLLKRRFGSGPARLEASRALGAHLGQLCGLAAARKSHRLPRFQRWADHLGLR
jgi:GT2 family glycosyltransferase